MTWYPSLIWRERSVLIFCWVFVLLVQGHVPLPGYPSLSSCYIGFPQKRNLTKLQLLVQPMPPSASRCFLQAWYLDSKYFKRIDEFLFIVHGVPATKCIQVSTTASLRTRASPLTNGGVGESNFPMSFAQRRFWTFCLLTFLQCVAGMVVSTLCREYITNPEEDQIKREQVYRSAVPGDSWVGLSDTMLYETFQVCT